MNAEDAREYVLFPVLDEHLFLPGMEDFDVARTASISRCAGSENTYLPVILSREVFDELVKSRLQDHAHIFVPRLVKERLQKLVSEQ